MSKNTPFAKEEVMEEYLSSLLRDVEDPAEATARTAKLLEQATVEVPDVAPVVTPPVVEKQVVEKPVVEKPRERVVAKVSPPDEQVIKDVVEQVAVVAQQQNAAPPNAPVLPLEKRLDDKFQALFFEVAGLTLAVPLITLGGIHQLTKLGPLFGKPKWFMGIMLHREEKLSVVDTAQWVMPEKYDQNLADQLNYQYLIMLGDSSWGLASEKLVNTVSLTKADVKWREASSKRPWLAGMVKDKMCALLDVDELIAMLDNGLGSKDQVP
ncbi:hypothetical protein AltI4_29770 [Alteromonas sp. I4]|nr:hypothetical protein AltI4_29770 [Alteromonas sp. I4]